MRFFSILTVVLFLTTCTTWRGDDVVRDGPYYIARYSQSTVTVSTHSDPFAPGTWSISCPIDVMSGKRNCSISSREAGGGLFIYYGASVSPQQVCILDNAAGTHGLIKVDQNEPVMTDETGCVPAGRIIGQIVAGGRIATRSMGTVGRHGWPSGIVADSSISLADIGKAMSLVTDIQQGRFAVKP